MPHGTLALFAILDLPVHGRDIGLVKQRMVIRRHDEERHEILKHGTAPRKKNRLAAGGSEQASQGKPTLLRQQSLRYRNKTAQSCL